MRSKRVVVCLALVVLTLAPALGAVAKGPESATLTGPGIKEPILVQNQDGSLNPFHDLLGLTGLWTGPRRELTEPPAKPGPRYTVTWTYGWDSDESIHQNIYLDAADGPVIHTPGQDGLRGWGPDVVGWFEAPDDLARTIEAIVAPSRAGTTPASPPPWLTVVIVAATGVMAWQVRQH